MATLGTTLANRLLDAVLGNSQYPPLLDRGFGDSQSLYLALFTSAPASDGSGTEVSGVGYARIAVANSNANWPPAVAGSKSNGTAISFGTSGGSWGTVTHVAVFDALTGGNIQLFGPLTQATAVASGAAVDLPAGSVVFSFPLTP